MISNCRIWALRQKRVFGGHLSTRQSRRYYRWGRGWWDHYLWSNDGEEWFEFVPMDESPPDGHWFPRWFMLPLPLFRGRVRRVAPLVAARLRRELEEHTAEEQHHRDDVPS